MRHHILFVLLSLVWSTSFLLMKRAALCYGDLAVAGRRCLLGAGFLGLFLLYRRRALPFRCGDLPGLIVLVVFSYLLPYTAQVFLVNAVGSGFTGMTVAFTPVLTVLVSVPMLSCRPTRRQLLGVCLALVCLLLLLWEQLRGPDHPLLLLAALAIPVSYAIGNTWNKRRFSGIPPIPLACTAMLLAGLVLVGLSAVTEEVQVNKDYPVAAVSLFLLGIFGTGLALAVFYRLIHERGPLYAGMVTYLVPVGAVFLGMLDGERVTRLQVVALAGVLLGVATAQIGNRPAQRQPTPIPQA